MRNLSVFIILICRGFFHLSDCILTVILLTSRFLLAAAAKATVPGELKRFVKTRPSKKKLYSFELFCQKFRKIKH